MFGLPGEPESINNRRPCRLEFGEKSQRGEGVCPPAQPVILDAQTDARCADTRHKDKQLLVTSLALACRTGDAFEAVGSLGLADGLQCSDEARFGLLGADRP